MADTIFGVPTDVTGFAGAGGPSGDAVAVTSAIEVDRLDLDAGALTTAAKAFFLNGGRTLYLADRLDALAEIDDIALVAAPTSANLPAEERLALAQELVAHAEGCRYRLALVDAPPDGSVAEVIAFRQHVDSSHAALYHPWVMVTERSEPAPPSGAVAGVLARTAAVVVPANQPLTGITGLAGRASGPRGSRPDPLEQQHVNLLRSFPGRGLRTWGARTLSTDPEWKYINVRRLFISLEHSIDRGTQWVVFEPNDEPLWNRVRRAVEGYLETEWRNGTFEGRQPNEAYFVRCDRSTMTQDDIDNGRLICLVGVAPLRPAEFMIFRIGQWTADAIRE